MPLCGIYGENHRRPDRPVVGLIAFDPNELDEIISSQQTLSFAEAIDLTTARIT